MQLEEKCGNYFLYQGHVYVMYLNATLQVDLCWDQI